MIKYFCLTGTAYLGLLGVLLQNGPTRLQRLSGGFKSESGQHDFKSSGGPGQADSKIVTITREWLKGKLSSPGTSAESRETSRVMGAGQLQVKYHVFVSGAPKDETYTLLEWQADASAPSTLVEGLTLSSNGLMVCAGRTPQQCGDVNKKDDPVDLTFNPTPGEAYRMALISEDRNTKVFFVIVPIPIIQKDNGCSLEAIALTKNRALVLILGKGFPPNEFVKFESNSYNETQNHDGNTDSNGEFVFGLEPFVKNRQNGTTEVKLEGANCAPVLKFDWGKMK